MGALQIRGSGQRDQFEPVKQYASPFSITQPVENIEERGFTPVGFKFRAAEIIGDQSVFVPGFGFAR